MIDNLTQHLGRSYEERQNIMYIHDGLYYRIASDLLSPGIKCDAVSQILRKKLPSFLEEVDKEAQEHYEIWMKERDK